MGEPRYRAGEWDPKFPEFAVPGEGPLADAPDNTGAEPWTEAPESSHLARFRFFDARQNSFLRKFGYGSQIGPRLGHQNTGNSQLVVVFKATKYAPETQYTYYFSDHDRGRAAFDAMTETEHPGEVVHELLIKGAVPYTKDAGKSY